MRRLWFLVRLAAALVLTGVLAGMTAVMAAPQVATMATSGSWTTSSIDLKENPTRSLVYDQNGNLMARWFRDNREPIDLEYIPDKVQSAVLAIEDTEFWEHKGINIRSTTRAALANVDAGGIAQGGSTITQQVIKNLVLNDDQTIERKIQEAALAVRLEDQASKEEILELYLNTVYFGAGAYGVRAAAEVYFGVDTTGLEGQQLAVALDRAIDWPKAALLASLISNPVAYDPFLYPDTSKRQRSIVLGRMAEIELISDEDAVEYGRDPIPVEPFQVEVEPEDYFVAAVRKELLENDIYLGGGVSFREEMLKTGGLRVYTAYDARAQELAEQARTNVLRGRYGFPGRFTTAIAAVDPNTGAVRAMLAGEDFREEEYNLVTQGQRQPGSSFKPFVLAAAFSEGVVPQDIINGRSPCLFPGLGDSGTPYKVENFGGSAGAVASLVQQTTSSSNCGYVKLGQYVGIDDVRATAHALGIESRLLDIPSLPLGTEIVTPLEMASAYGGFANGGLKVQPYLIERIEDAEGNIIYDVTTDPSRRPVEAIAPRVACTVTSVLQENARSGTGVAAQGPMGDQPIAGKTGTAEDFKDAWFVGYTPYLSTAVWVGNPTVEEQMRAATVGLNVTGGSVPAEIWGEFNRLYRAEYAVPTTPFPPCEVMAGPGKLLRTDFDDDLRPSPCPGSFPIDSNGDGLFDICAGPGVSTGGYFVCSGPIWFGSDGSDVPMYCPNTPPPTAAPDPGTDDGGGDGGGDDAIASDDGGGDDGGGDGGGGGAGGGGADGPAEVNSDDG